MLYTSLIIQIGLVEISQKWSKNDPTWKLFSCDPIQYTYFSESWFVLVYNVAKDNVVKRISETGS